MLIGQTEEDWLPIDELLRCLDQSRQHRLTGITQCYLLHDCCDLPLGIMDRFHQPLGFALTVHDSNRSLFEPMKIILDDSLQQTLDPLITWCHIQQHGCKLTHVLSDLCAEISDNRFDPL